MSNPLPKFVLDSSALLAFFQGESGGKRIQILLEKAQRKNALLLLSTVQYGEVLYATERYHGKKQRNKIEELLETLPLRVISATLVHAKAAADIKAQGGIAYPDGFVIALAQEKKATILTKDKEFQKFEKEVDVEWL